MITQRVTFRKVSWVGRKAGKCEGCGKPLKRQRTFTHTVNPFNVKEDGTPKSYPEVLEGVKAAAKAWEAEPLVCPVCRDERRAGA